MKKEDIFVGKTYVNRGAGRVTRTVLDIGENCAPTHWFGAHAFGARPVLPEDRRGVLYVDSRGKTGNLYIESFASWVSKEVPKT